MPANEHVSKPRIGALHLDWRAGHGWFVKDEYGTNLAGPFQCENKALMSLEARQRNADRAAKRGPRACMCCGRQFVSEGIHNRMCLDCRHRDIAPDPFSPGYRSRSAA